jgi:uncharacterized delta-60 repeat protein
MKLERLIVICLGLLVLSAYFAVARAADGGADTSFSAGNLLNSDVFALAVQPDGKIIVCGDFFDPNGITHEGILRLNPDGTSDATFGGTGASQVRAVALQPDGKILIGGYFSTVNGTPRQRIARLNSDGSLDTSFDPGSGVDGNNRLVDAIVLLPLGQILIGGDFTSVNGVQRTSIARLNGDGTVDQSFNAGAVTAANSQIIVDIALQADKILVAGFFDSIGGGTAKGIARLNASGGLDATFNVGGAGVNGGVETILVQSDNRIVLGGFFTSYNGTPRVDLARVNTDGSLDTNFVPNISNNFNTVYDVTILRSKKILIVGNFDTVDGQFANRIARLKSDGSLDRSFRSGTGSPVDYVFVALLQNDNRVLIGGSFAAVQGRPRNRIARLANGTAGDFDGDGRSDISVFRPADGTWYLQQSYAGFSAFQFGLSSDTLVPADYDGDGKTDIGVYRDGAWYILSSRNGFVSVAFGLSGDIPQPADFDGDRIAELAVFRPSSGAWYILNRVTNQFKGVSFGAASDKPTAADYDGDGKADISVFRPSQGAWYRLGSINNQFTAISFGISSDQVVPADYDGDGKTDVAVFRGGDWYRLNSSNGQFVAFHWGAVADRPVPVDFDGDAKTDFAVFRDGTWYLQQSFSGFAIVGFGQAGDQPIPVVP